MYKIDASNGDIHFPGGEVLCCPYDSPRYLEYATWVQAGNTPEIINQPG